MFKNLDKLHTVNLSGITQLNTLVELDEEQKKIAKKEKLPPKRQIDAILEEFTGFDI